jgi:multidrug efflux system membrane fusion protein
MRPNLMLAAGALAAGLALGACDPEEPKAQPPMPVRVQVVESHDLAASLRYSANIVPARSVNLAFQVSGYVTSILQRAGADGKPRDLQTGDAVENGAVLAAVDDRPYQDKVKGAQAQLAEAKASLVKGENDYRRATALFKEQSMTAPEYDTYKKEFQAAQAAVGGAKAQLDAAEQDLEHTRLIAPSNGLVLQRNIEIGGLAAPGTVGFVIADVGSVKAVFGVPAVTLGDVKQGSPMSIVTESEPGRKFDGRITSIAASADSSTRVFDVEVTVPNSDGRLKPGMVASLDIVRETAPSTAAVVVPLAALVRSKSDPKGYAVYLVAGEGDTPTVRLQDVTVGRILGNTIAVTGGLAPGARIVVYGATLVADGQTVRVIP